MDDLYEKAVEKAKHEIRYAGNLNRLLNRQRIPAVFELWMESGLPTENAEFVEKVIESLRAAGWATKVNAVRDLMELTDLRGWKQFPNRAAVSRKLRVDKSTVKRWIDEERPWIKESPCGAVSIDCEHPKIKECLSN